MSPYRPLVIEVTDDMKIIYELNTQELREAVAMWLTNEHHKDVPDSWKLQLEEWRKWSSGAGGEYVKIEVPELFKVIVSHSSTE